jgi:hypothetical protein
MNQREVKMKLHRLKEVRAELVKEMESLQGKIAGIDIAIRTIESDDSTASPSKFTHDISKKRIPLKRPILEYLEEVGAHGLTANEAVEKSESKFDRASVSSLLSRLKADGLLTLVKDRYFLIKYAPKAAAEIPSSAALN